MDIKKIILSIIVLHCSSAFALFSPSNEKAQKELDSLYVQYFVNLDFNGELVFSLQNQDDKIQKIFLGIHRKASKIGSVKGHWSYAINKLPNECKEILESGKKLPQDYESELYPKNRPTFPRKPFYEIVRNCEEYLNKIPSLISNYDLALDQMTTKMVQKAKKDKETRVAKEQAKEKESKHPNYTSYQEWIKTLDKLSKSRVFEFVCEEENKYNQQLFTVCLNAEHTALNLIQASLENLWGSMNGRKNMKDLINLLDSDLKDSMKVVNGKNIPDMVLTKIRFRKSLKRYFKVKGFSVYDAVAVLN